MTSVEERRRRLGEIIGGVAAAAVREAGATGIVLVDDGSPEVRLSIEWCTAALGVEGTIVVAHEDAAPVESALQMALNAEGSGALPMEGRRALARAVALHRGALVGGHTNKTALILTAAPSPEPLLPLGDLWASQVQALEGGWTAPPDVRKLAEAAGGIDVLDAALQLWCDRRESLPAALRQLPSTARGAVKSAIVKARFARRCVGLVPKLGRRTPGIDLLA